jgi:hypothetical protein
MPAESSKNNFSASLFSKLNLKYTGTKPSVTRLKLNMEMKEILIDSQLVKIKLEANDEALEQHGVICIDVESTANRLPKDILDFQGENEPTVLETIHLTMGRVSKEDKDKGEAPCLSNHVDIKISGKAARSADQRAEAESNTSPYGECRSQKGSPSYPGPFVPPSPQCFAAAQEQTNLRAGNFTISYKVGFKQFSNVSEMLRYSRQYLML